MAVAGDIVVKLAADFAEFSKGMADSQAQLVKFGETATAQGEKFNAFVDLAKKALAGLSVASIVNQIQQYADGVQKAAASVADLARANNLTTSQVQALQVMAQRTGDSFSDLVKKGQANSDWLEQVTADAQRLGLVMDSEVVQKLKTIQAESDEASRRMQVFFSPAIAGTKSFIADSLERIAHDLTVVAGQQGIIDKIIALVTMLGYSGGPAGAQGFALDTLQRNLDKAEAELKSVQSPPSPREIGLGLDIRPEQIDEKSKAVDRAREALARYKDEQAKAAYGTTTPDPLAVTVTATKLPSGGGGTPDDTIERQIARYQALGKAADATYDTIKAGQGEAIDLLQRQVTVQQQVDAITERLATKGGIAPTPEQIERLRQAVTAYEAQRAENAKVLDDNVKAAALEQKLGDGTAAHTKALTDLNRQMATGRVSADTYSRALKEQDEAITSAALNAQRYDDNLGSLGAGFEDAANKFSRSHDLFSAGTAAFNGLTSAMDEGLDVLAGKSSKTFDQIASDFALMLAKMAIQAAASAVFKSVFGAIGGVTMGGEQFGPPAPAVSGVGTPRAAGGPVEPGQMYRVGEYGPENFVPAAAGNIVPMGPPAGGVTVNVDMSGGQTGGTSNPQQALEFGRRVKAAVVGVIQNEQRPGGTLYQRRS